VNRPLTGNIRAGRTPLDVRGYEAAGGYAAVRATVGRVAPAEVIRVVTESGLAGCGGGGFPTGRKWAAMPARATRPGTRYFIVNADEMEPGTFKDRLLLEGDPHQLIEGMILAAYAVDADCGYIFVRGEYKLAIARLNEAVAQAEAAGYLGKNILGSGQKFAIHVHGGAGRYICGEETALLNSLEGKRAIPRAKPPLPQVSGLFGAPTIVNNVETICNVPHIVKHGPEWYRALGVNGEAGTRIFGVSGRVKNPGAFERPAGILLRDLIEGDAGGMLPGFALRAVLPGGASTGFIPADQLDVAMSNKGMAAIGNRLGTGNVIVLDDSVCPVAFMANLQQFFARESCGWCAPCRDGLPWAEQILKSIDAGAGKPRDLGILGELTDDLAPGRTFCGLAPGAMASLKSGLACFAEEFAAHLSGGCAWT
jgi:NADH-quinone oxidoreductase subunit F